MKNVRSMKINSELPLQMLKDNYDLNEYDFVLFHLYISNEEYREYYKSMRRVHPDRTMILDNSAYEFFIKGEKLDLMQFKVAIEDLKPDYYILPDVLMDQQATLDGIQEFCNTCIPLNCDAEPIAVAQGKTEEELVECLHIYGDEGIDAICIPFHNSFFKDLGQQVIDDDISMIYESFMDAYNIDDIDDITDDMKYAMGRVRFFVKYWFIIKTFEYVHMLGSHCPYEKHFYHEIDSMDTGYPVKLAHECIMLGKEKSKPSTIIDDFLTNKITVTERKLIHVNIERFKGY